MRIPMAIFGISLGVAAAMASPSPPPTGWKTYTNHVLGYSISYPAGWRVDPKYVYAGFGPDYPIEGVAFEIPPSMAKGTNLSDDLTNVSVESRDGAGVCDARRFIPDPDDMHDVKAFGRTWSVATQDDAGMGNIYDITVFVVKGSNPCLAVRYFIHSTQIGNYDPGTVREFNRATLLRTFDKIRSTLVTEPH